MPIITISRGVYSHGKAIAEEVARRLGYQCVSREILLEASEAYNVPEIKLIRAIHDAPSILERMTGGKKRYLSYIQASLLKHLKGDNVVYHGLSGQFFLAEVSHVLKVRIIAELEDRIEFEMKQEGISRSKAKHTIEKDDNERRRWSQQLYGLDIGDSHLYDLVIRIKRFSTENAVDMICHALDSGQFQTTPDSQRSIDDLYLAASARAILVDLNSEADVTAKDGVIQVKVNSITLEKQGEMRHRLNRIPGVKDIDIKAQGLDLRR